MASIAPIFCETINWTAFYSVFWNLGLIVEIKQGIRTELPEVSGKFLGGKQEFNASWSKEFIEMTVDLEQDEDKDVFKKNIKQKLQRIGAACLEQSNDVLVCNIPTANLFISTMNLIPKTNSRRRKF